MTTIISTHDSLLKIGQENLNQGNEYEALIKQWLKTLNLTNKLDEKALIYSNIGIAYRKMGRVSEAIAQWQQAILIYQSQNQNSENKERLARLLIDQAQAYSALGQQQQAIVLLQKVLGFGEGEILQLAQGSLGNAHLALGEYQQAIAAYQESIRLTRNPHILASGWMNLGNAFARSVERYQGQIEIESEEANATEVTRLKKLRDRDLAEAYIAYQKSLSFNDAALLQAQALLNLGRLEQAHYLPNHFFEPKELIEHLEKEHLEKATKLLAIAPDSPTKVYALIDLASLYSPNKISVQIQVLHQALSIAQSIGDRRGESFVMGAIGKVYEMNGNLNDALKYTNQAQWLAQAYNSADSLYLWQWQIARILKAKGDRLKSIESYRQAIATLQSIRSDIVAADRNFQFDVRDRVEPVYRELIELLLSENNSQLNPEKQKAFLEEALQVADLLRLAELQNFFGDECLQNKGSSRKQQEQSKQKIALINSITLDKQTYMVMRLPDGFLKSYVVPLSRAELNTKIKYLRFTLENVATNEYLNPTREIYDLLIRPFEQDLQRSPVELLAFVNDDILRSIPIAALYDGKQFLIQKYPIVYLVESKLTENLTQTASKLNLLAFGLSEAIAPFAALPKVLEELHEVETIWKSKSGEKISKIFLNQDFTFETLRTQIKSGYEVVHLATHAKFGATPEATYLQAFDRKINLEQLEAILRSSRTQIELLILSACQTATGSNRATLGLAGVALRSGVNNVLATLWAVDDTDVVPLVKDFYNEWQINGLTKAQALQKAQIKGITQNNLHPASWSAFILVAN
ncbi:CHAT domain-containing protein [Pseudanabaena sp. FACHB-1998]|uniref:CHAT domain-containing tetratricopeptide repeat protein n=1 Tax=Pseudanabaena sp. FACHB-1998 TaxID=2692858 RepID=UPI001680732E|nr:CHAT domain-containing protein [Pseudanabaena sp. FACHB-1998]